MTSWEAALLLQATMRRGEKADKLFTEAYEKFAHSLQIQPDKRDAISTGGSLLPSRR
jgi:hypothetical protein